MKYALSAILITIACCVNRQQQESSPVDSVKTTSAVQHPSQTKKDERPVMKRISFGGSTAFWINLHSTYVEISPMIAYHFPKILTAGVGYRYIYTRDRFYGKI